MKVKTAATAMGTLGLFVILETASSGQVASPIDNSCIGGLQQIVTTPEGDTVYVQYPRSLACLRGSIATTGAIAIGTDATATAPSAVALGNNAAATHQGSTAIGASSQSTAANQVTLGGTGSSVRIGDIDASTAAQSGPVAIATVDANGTIGRSTVLIPALQADIGELFDLRRLDRREMRQGIAAAAAMGSAPMPSAPGRTSYVLNGSSFRGQQALGGSFMHRLDTRSPFAISAGFSYAGNKNNVARIGVAGEF